MVDSTSRMLDWFAGTVDVLNGLHVAVPARPVLGLLQRGFDVTAASWHWRNADGRFGDLIEPDDTLDAELDVYQEWQSGRLVDCNPLLTWHTVTNNFAPMTAGRVPTALVPARRRSILTGPLVRLGLEQQLTINYRLDHVAHRAFVLARGGRDFDDDDLLLARYAQRSLVALDKQTRILAGAARCGVSLAGAAELGLTGRELALLCLLSGGASLRMAAARLDCTPAVAEAHLRRACRKLGARTRSEALHRVRTELRVVPALDRRTPAAG